MLLLGITHELFETLLRLKGLSIVYNIPLFQSNTLTKLTLNKKLNFFFVGVQDISLKASS